MPTFAGRSRGFSLVELMVALTLSLVLMAGALSILYSSRLTYAENERLARVQEAGRTTLELIMRDVRASGFNGCARIEPSKFSNVLNNPTGLLWNFSRPIYGYDGASGAWTPALDTTLIPDATEDSDVLVVRTSRLGSPVMRTNAPTTNPLLAVSVDMNSSASVPANSTLVISDCEYATVFAATSTFGGATTASIPHVQAAGVEPGNLVDSIRTNYPIDALIQPIDTVIYYVRESASGNGPALWQKVGDGDPQELVQGVENLQIQYGIDTTGDLLVDEYVTADEVEGPPNRWGNVVSISFAVLIRSETETGVETDKRTYDLLGTELGPFNDRRQRSVFITTVTLRNGAT